MLQNIQNIIKNKNKDDNIYRRMSVLSYKKNIGKLKIET